MFEKFHDIAKDVNPFAPLEVLNTQIPVHFPWTNTPGHVTLYAAIFIVVMIAMFMAMIADNVTKNLENSVDKSDKTD